MLGHWQGERPRGAAARPLAIALAAALLLAASCGKEEKPPTTRPVPPSGGYIDSMLSGKDLAEATVCRAQLKGLAGALASYAATHEGKYPPSLAELNLLDRQLHCPSRKGKRYLYVAGQDRMAPAASVLVYEDAPVHEGKCNVLRADGSVAALTPEELRKALAATKGSPK